MGSRRHGLTLIEVMVSLLIGGMILTVIYELFIYFGRESQRPMASMSMEQSTLTIVRWLQHDLAETDLQSIRSYAGTGGSNGPALSFELPRNNKDQLQMSAFGVVDWTKSKWVYYRLMPSGKTVQLANGTSVPVGELTYDESANPPAPPMEPTGGNFPGTYLSSKHRTMGTNFTYDTTAGSYVGFHAYWLQGGTKKDFGNTAVERGEPVIVDMTFQDESTASGKLTTRQAEIQIKPQN